MIEHWNGTAWKVQASSNPGGAFDVLDGIAAASSSRAWAVGSYENAGVNQTLIEYWNGMAWKVQASPNVGTGENVLVAAAATSGANAWAVGHYHTGTHDATLIERWNGISWKRVPSPNPEGSTSDNLLFGVAATSATSAWAVGYHDNGTTVLSLVEHWNGTAWRRVPTPSPGGPGNTSTFWGVAGTNCGNAWAVGYYSNGTGNTALALHC